MSWPLNSRADPWNYDGPQMTASEMTEKAWTYAEAGHFLGAAQLFETAAQVMRELHTKNSAEVARQLGPRGVQA